MKRMNPLNHLLMAALFLTALPCFHATGHELHVHGLPEASAVSVSHSCYCHDCSEMPCPEAFEMPQQGSSAITPLAAAHSPLVLFVAPETTTDYSMTAADGSRRMETIRTVQLLI
jgi:hypothetical protein